MIQTKQTGFSLVELSIVLVILGLLVGGILGGKSLIRASELRTVTTEYSKYVAATQTFRGKYFALPGDIPNATQFWGTVAGTPALCETTASTDARTCNGDGDGRVSYILAQSIEALRFWQHLANAGMIEGTYSGINDTNKEPRGKISDTYWSTLDWGNSGPGNWSWFEGSYGHIFMIGSSPNHQRGLLTPEEAWSIDTKLDDGRPGLGKVVMESYDGVEFCTTAASGADTLASATAANYLLTSSDKTCALMFRNAY